jgi:hypothetical protein
MTVAVEYRVAAHGDHSVERVPLDGAQVVAVAKTRDLTGRSATTN